MGEKYVDLNKFKIPKKIRKSLKPMINMLYLIYRDNLGYVLGLIIDSIQDLTEEREQIRIRNIEIKYNDYFASKLNCDENKYEYINNKKVEYKE